MYRRQVILTTALLGLVSCTSPRVAMEPGSSAGSTNSPLSRTYDFGAVESRIRAATKSGKLPSVAFAIAKNGRVVHESSFGWANREQQVASTVRTPYPLASVSKPITATALAMLHERGLVDLEAPARRYAGSWFSHQVSDGRHADYSLRHLLNHTAGLGPYARIYWCGQDRAVQSLDASFRKYGFTAQPPGTVFGYSNLGYGLIGHIIEERVGTSLADFLESGIFGPLGMHDSMMVDSFSSPTNAAKKYDVRGAPLVNTYNDTPGAGSVYASVHDLALFGIFHLDSTASGSRQILSQQSKLLMRNFTDPSAKYPYYNSSHYGLGWYVRTNDNGETVVWHEGGMPGASAIIVLLPQQNITAAVVINATDANLQAQAFVNALIQVVEPAYHAPTFNATEGFDRFTNQHQFLGRWEGSIAVDGKDLPWALNFEADGSIRAEFPQYAAGSILPAKVTFPALVNGDLLVATFAATLPAPDVDQTPDGYVLLRLLRRGDELSGAAIAYASEHRLEHLYPFSAHLRRKEGLPRQGR